jgi:hypothetical protein
MNRKLCTFAGIVLFTLMMAGRAEAQHDCGEFCRGNTPCNYFCDLWGQPSSCLAYSMGSCTLECWSTCNAIGATCDTFCWDDNNLATTCGESPYWCSGELASNTQANAAADAGQCVASSSAPTNKEAGQTCADVNRRRADDVGESSGLVQDIR